MGHPRRLPQRKYDRQYLMDLIDGNKLLRRYLLHALGELTDENGEPTEMTDGQIRATEFLLRRVIPEVKVTASAVEHTFNGNPASLSNAALITELLDRKPGNDAEGTLRIAP